MFRHTVLLLSVSLLCVSCNDAAIESSQSLVGAKDLPSEKALSRETLNIRRGGGPYGGDRLDYEWLPDNALTITHTFFDASARQTVKGQETLRVTPEVAAQIRWLLRRVRPAKFEGVENYGALPIGCERQGPHDFGEVAVVFIKEGAQSGGADGQVGIFELPFPESCNTPAAAEARKVVWEALRLLPESKVAAGFERAA